MRWLNYLLFFSGVLWLVLTLTLPDSYLHVVFCDVGQGDGAIISYGFTQITIDAGPQTSKFAQCLTNHLPFYDRNIELAIGTHPQADHEGGYLEVLGQYHVEKFVTTRADNSAKFFTDLLAKMPKAHYASARDILAFGPLELLTVWPTPDFVGSDINQSGLVERLSFGQFNVLFSADADQPTDQGQLGTKLLSKTEILKVPHHGSKTGMTETWLAKIHPQMAVISVGATNTYGHPAPETLDLLAKYAIRVLRTDQQGTIEIISDGTKYWLR